MYRIEFIDFRQHVDQTFSTYEEAMRSYASIINTCLQSGLPFRILLCDENGECIASSDCNFRRSKEA